METASEQGYDWTHCDCGLELLVLDESLSGMPNHTWTRDVPYIVAQAQCAAGHTPYLLKRRGHR